MNVGVTTDGFDAISASLPTVFLTAVPVVALRSPLSKVKAEAPKSIQEKLGKDERVGRRQTMKSVFARRAFAVGVAAFFGLMSATSLGEAGRAGRIHIGGAVKGGTIQMSGGVDNFQTNPGGKYVPYGGGVGKFHTNPGGKYVYRGYGSKFHTNPGGKYVYPGRSAAPR